MKRSTRTTRTRVALALVVMAASVAACGHSKNERNAAGNVAQPPSTQPAAVPGASYGEPPAAGVDTTTKKTPKHHSKLAGALVGGAAGHMVGHPIAGAVAGAVVQHERNKHKQ